MNPIVKTILAIIAGAFVGGLVNMGIIMLGSGISVPEGVDPMDVESIKANIDKYQYYHFIVPFLAHAIGTLVGAYLAVKIAGHKMVAALVVAALFLYGGISMVMQLPSPMWFNVLDLVGAYIPMGLLGHKLATKA